MITPSLAERVGFEPTEHLPAFTRFPGGRVRPTTLPLQYCLEHSYYNTVFKNGVYVYLFFVYIDI